MIIVTAGHVDHGKTSLVRHLTGIDTDRLKDEQTRGLTIDLGFAYADLEGLRVGFVDVPGHIRFIHNMLAGVSGVQLALLVIAADDGPMPQTREHLAIIEALGLPSLLVAHTKVDRVDQARREASRQEISALLASTAYASANIIDVSNATLEGIEPFALYSINLPETCNCLTRNQMKTSQSRIFVCPLIESSRSRALGPSSRAPWQVASSTLVTHSSNH